MTLRKKIFLLILVCMVLFSGTLLLFSEFQSRQDNLIINSVVKQQEIIVKNAILGHSDQLQQIVTDYTNWDDIIVYIKRNDPKWAIDNIATIIKSFNLNSVGVLSLDSRMVYGFGNSPAEMLGTNADKNEILRQLRKSEFIHYFRKTPAGILEISAASIHPTLDTNRLTKGQGYFFISKLWDKQLFQNLSKKTGSAVTVENTGFKVTNSFNKASLYTEVLISDHNKVPLCKLVFREPNKFLASYHRISSFVMYFLAMLLVIVLSLFFYTLYHWVRRPLRIISETLKTGDTNQLKELQNNHDEFSQIAGLIVKFNEQRKELESENAERKQVQQQIAEHNELLNGLAEASSRLLTIDNLDDAIKEALGAIVSHTNIDRIFIYKNIHDNSGLLKSQRIYDWIQPAFRSLVNASEYEEYTYIVGPEGWSSGLQKGQIFKGFYDEFGDTLKTLFEKLLVKSVMIVPIIDPLEHTFWGFAGFADCKSLREWRKSDETTFSLLANNIGGAIRRYLSQLELKEMMELARSADKAKSDFLASMSHEIRTPMNGVIGMTSLLLQSDLTPLQRDYVQTIETSGDSLLNIINEILDFSKIESGRMVLEESPFDLRRCVEDVLDLMAPKMFEKQLELIYYIDPKINFYIFGDGFRLRQVLVNLIGNAIKFTAKGEILVLVNLKNLDGESVVLEFSVKDTGIGIPPDKINDLFNPFTQVDASTTRKYGGSGLGLAISANLIKLMNGKIWVESKLGIGSDFKFTVHTRSILPPENSNKSIEKLQLLHGKKVLIVDDNYTNRRILLLQFSFWNINSIAVTSGLEALELLDAGERFDVAILDMQMPDMDGEMLAREIRKRFTKPELPLIMLTSIGFTVRTPEVQQLFSYYVNKPLKHSRLAEILLSVFMLDNSDPDPKNISELELKNISEKFPLEILIAEDNYINQKLIRKLFEVLGYKTDLAANGYEVIDALKRKRYNLIFMDIQMPEMDGYEATRLIKERWGAKAPVIVAMTANAMQGDREKCMLAGMDDYVSKPLRLEDLLRVLNYWGEIKECIFLSAN